MYNFILVFCLSFFCISCFKNNKTDFKQKIEKESVKKPRQVSNEDYKIIPSGSYITGSPIGENGREDDEIQLPVKVNSFYMKNTEVTQNEWMMFSMINPSRFQKCGLDCPVEQVNWYEGAEYMNWLSEKEGLEICYEMQNCKGNLGKGCADKNQNEVGCVGDYICEKVIWNKSCNGYRYPTEVEWEYAARGGEQKEIYTGSMTIKDINYSPELNEIAVYGGNSEASYADAFECSHWPGRQNNYSYCGTSKVGSKKPNSYGLYDMIGNVWEWNWNKYNKKSAVLNKEEVYVFEHSNAPNIFRGCGWHNFAKVCRSAVRNYNSPNMRFAFLGLRPVRSIIITTE